MKKITLTAALVTTMTIALGASSTVSANTYTTLERTDHWYVSRRVDALTDGATCFLTHYKEDRFGAPGLMMAVYTPQGSGPWASAMAYEDIPAGGITYRIDKEPAVEIGYTSYGRSDPLFIQDGAYKRLVDGLKRGKSVYYRAHSSNEFVEDGETLVSLEGFTRLYEIAEKCEDPSL